MKLFKCQHCGQPVYFENYFCVHCNAALGFDWQQVDMLSLQVAADDATLFTTGSDDKKQYKYCSNKQYHVCNWLLPHNSEAEFCLACNLNHTIPDLSEPDHWEKWASIEVAKHRLVYALLRLKLPIISKFQDAEKGIAFNFMAEENKGERLLTGHDNGLITLNIAEADDVIREMARNQMDEVYRTLLGHFRHEIGHYYWDRLIKDSGRLQSFRDLFGDETINYSEALQQHYNKPASEDWRKNFISAYAGAHPWEDWAETWAHYLHIIDTLETAYSFGLSLHPKAADSENKMSATINIDAYATKNFTAIIDKWTLIFCNEQS